VSARCPTCGGIVVSSDDLTEALVERSLEQGAWVEIVHDVAADMLGLVGGIAAWTRY